MKRKESSKKYFKVISKNWRILSFQIERAHWIPAECLNVEPHQSISYWIFRILGTNAILKSSRKEKILQLKDQESEGGTSLVAQWLRIRLLMQGTWVQALVREDPTCRGGTKSVCHNYWVCALEPASHNYRAHVPQLLKPTCLEPMLGNKRSHCNEKPAHHKEE